MWKCLPLEGKSYKTELNPVTSAALPPQSKSLDIFMLKKLKNCVTYFKML